jgi:hypothetical protein
MNEQGKSHYSSSGHHNQNKDIPNQNACLQVNAGVDQKHFIKNDGFSAAFNLSEKMPRPISRLLRQQKK